MIMRTAMTNQMPVILLLISALMWGLTWWPLKAFNAAGIDGIPLILIAYGVVGLSLLWFIVREWHRWQGKAYLLLLFFVLGGYANLAFASSMIYGDVVRAMMLFYLGPVWGVLGGRVFLGERIDLQRWSGVLCALIGAWLILGGETAIASPPSPIDLLALTAGMAFALNNICFRATRSHPTGSKVAAMFLGCGVFAAVLMPLQGDTLPVLPVSVWAGLLAFGMLWLLGATIATQWSVTRMEAGRASILLLSELLVAVVSATLIGGETMSTVELIGGALILSSAILEAWRQQPDPHDFAKPA
jgi:drug/metabolite transporter (DMT)-like permease